MARIGDLFLWMFGKCIWLFFVLLVLSNARCSTITPASLGTQVNPGPPVAERWLAEHESSSAKIALRTEPALPSRRGVLVWDAPSRAAAPADAHIRLVSGAGVEAIPLTRVHQISAVRRGRGALEGALVGAGVGVITGIVFGLAKGDSRNLEDCGYPCTADQKVEMGALVLGGLGTATGALIGAAIGHRDVLAF